MSDVDTKTLLRLIDVLERCLVSEKYVALSYVRGKGKIEVLRKDSFEHFQRKESLTPEAVPRIVSDASRQGEKPRSTRCGVSRVTFLFKQVEFYWSIKAIAIPRRTSYSYQLSFFTTTPFLLLSSKTKLICHNVTTRNCLLHL